MEEKLTGLEKFLYDNYSQDIIVILKILANKNKNEIIFYGAKSVNKFLQALNFKDKLILHKIENFLDLEIYFLSYIYKEYNDSSWLIGDFLLDYIEIEISKLSPKPFLFKALYPLLIEINYKNEIKDMTNLFRKLFLHYPKSIIIYQEDKNNFYYDIDEIYNFDFENKKFRLKKISQNDFATIKPMYTFEYDNIDFLKIFESNENENRFIYLK